MPDVLLIQARQPPVDGASAPARACTSPTPAPCRPGLRASEHDRVVQNPQRLGIGSAVQAIDGLDELLRAEHFVRVQTAVDPDDDLPVPGQPACAWSSSGPRPGQPRLIVLVLAPAVCGFAGEVMIAVGLPSGLRPSCRSRRRPCGPIRRSSLCRYSTYCV